ncbi:MAG: cellulose synthase operon protein YhjQ/BcsQ [bacterium]
MPRETTPGSGATRPMPHIAPSVAVERVVVVASGKGGVGTSVCASLLALACASLGGRTLLIDGNEGNGTLHHLLKVRPVRSLDALRDPRVPVSDVCVHLGDAFTLVACKPASGEQITLTPDARRAPLERVLALSMDYDCVVVDGGSRLDGILAVTGAGAARAVIVTDADRIALAANFALLKVLSTQAPHVQSRILVNRHDDAVALRAGAQLTEACSRFLGAEISLAGSVPDDACLRAAIGAGMPIGDAAHDSPASVPMAELALAVFPQLVAAQGADAHRH